MAELQPAIFLDRDGTLNIERNYLHRPAELQLIPGVPEAIGRLNRAGYRVIVVTNQAGIARGMYTPADMRAVHARLTRLLGEVGAHVDAFMFCPHHPDFTGPCDCRKPAPGMLLAASSAYGITLQQSWLVGDAAGDIGAGQAAGCRTVLVRTGYGAALEPSLDAASARPDAIVDALPEAVEHILANAARPQSSE